MRRVITAGIALLLLALVAGGCGSASTTPDVPATPTPQEGYHGTVIEPAAEMPPFELIGVDGDPLSSEDYRGRILAVYFGYTHCPDICPLSLGILKRAVESLTPEEQEQVAVLMVAVDPERDTPEVLGRYVALFHPDFEAATGDPAVVSDVLASWGVEVTRSPVEDGRYTVSHPASIYFLDRQGRWVLALDHSQSAEHFADDMRRLIQSDGADAAVGTPGATATVAPADEQDTSGVRWFFALGDGSVVMREPDGAEREVLAQWSVEPSEDDLAQRQYPGARELAYDAATGMLWFADTHEAIHSVHVDTGVRGTTIDGFADAALPGCGVADLSREFALLPGGRLIVPTLLGTTLVYSTEDGSMLTALSPVAFGTPLLAQFRPFVAPVAGTNGWFVDGSGVMHPFDADSWILLEGAVGPLPDAPTSAFLEVVMDPGTGTLVYLTESGELRAWDVGQASPVDPPVQPPADTRSIAAG